MKGSFSMKQEPQPIASSRDHYSQRKGKVEKNIINKTSCNSPTKEKQRSKNIAIQAIVTRDSAESIKVADLVV